MKSAMIDQSYCNPLIPLIKSLLFVLSSVCTFEIFIYRSVEQNWVAKMSASLNGTHGTPLYTVEQLELIRRLRNSGISKEDIVTAFDSFDRLDRELGPVYNIPVTLVCYSIFIHLNTSYKS